MNAEIISIGSELTDGAKLDTNSQWLSQQLTDLGVTVRFHTTVADDLAENIAVLRIAVARADIVLITGGLGPTLDDLTREALAAVGGVALALHAPSLASIEAIFAQRGRTMPERNRVQAMFPEGSVPLPNPAGTAPGIWMEIPRADGRPPCRLAAMPGVPSEMFRMFEYEVRPRLPASGAVIRRARLNCFGIGESHAEQLLGDLTARGRDPEIGITAHEATITLRITAVGANADECERKILAATESIRHKLGEFVYGVEDEEIQDVVVRQLLQAGKTLATVEAGTRGLLAQRLAETHAVDQCYLGGLVLPTEALQQVRLGIDPTLFQSAGSASSQVAQELAFRWHEQSGANFALAISSDRGGDARDLSQPVVYAALSTPDGVRVLPIQQIGNRQVHRSRTVKSALNLLRLYLIERERRSSAS